QLLRPQAGGVRRRLRRRLEPRPELPRALLLSVGGRSQAELACDWLHCRDDVRDVLVELEPEQLRAGIDLVAVNPGPERGLLELLLHRLRLEAVEAGGPYEPACVDEARELVAGEEDSLELRIAWNLEVLCMREHGVDELLGVPLLAQDRRTVLGMLVEGGM